MASALSSCSWFFSLNKSQRRSQEARLLARLDKEKGTAAMAVAAAQDAAAAVTAATHREVAAAARAATQKAQREAAAEIERLQARRALVAWACVLYFARGPECTAV